MKLPKWLNRQLSFTLGSMVVLIGAVVPSLIPAFASAASLDSRSIAMTNTAASATGVTYHLTATTHADIDFTSGTPASTGGLIVQFCSDSPLVGQTCTAPDGMNVSDVNVTGSTTAGTASAFDSSTSIIEWQPSQKVNGGDTLDIDFNDITNPNTVDPFYARLTTYTASVDYTSATSTGTVADDGGVALSTTNTIGVTAYVEETMTFCVSSDEATDASCTGATGSPSMTLGVLTNGVKVLGTTASTGTDYAQLDTNAAHGAVANLHSDATGCGGLVLAGEGACNITAQTTAGTLTNGSAKFGLIEGPAAAVDGDNIGDTPAISSGYSNTDYYINYVSGDATGVTSTYGSPLFSVAGPSGGYNLPITFGAVAGATTPAGTYSANLNLVATGTF